MTSVEPGARAPDCPSRVLLVEDNPVIAMNTQALLEDLGVESVSVAGSVADALALIGRERFDLAILDLKLGEGEDSLPVAERLRASGVPFIFATGFGEDVGFPLTYATTIILKKPYSFEDLRSVIVGR